MSRVTFTIALAALFVAAGCGEKPRPQPPPTSRPASQPAATKPAPPSNRGRIVIDCQPGNALVTLDGNKRGTAKAIGDKGGLDVDRGVHRLEVRLRGYKPFRIEINVGERPEYLRVRLERTRR